MSDTKLAFTKNQPLSILYVDDEGELLTLGKLFMERSGDCRVDILSSAQEALDSPMIQYYDAIVSDYQMPGTDGIEFLKAIRKQYGEIPFILFTGRGREEIAIESINNGADFYVQKGGDAVSQFAELTHKIKQAVQRRKAEISLRESEEKFRVLADSSPVAIVVHQDSKFVYVNDHMSSIIGYSKEELYFKDFWEIVHPDHLEMVKEYGLTRLKRDDVPFRYDVKILTKSGETLWEDLTAGIIQYNGKPALIVLLVDITKKKKTEEELQAAYEQLAASDEQLQAQFGALRNGLTASWESEQKYRAIIENLPGAFFRTGMEGNLIMLSPSFAEQCGYSGTEELLNKNIREFFYYDPSDHDELLNKLKRYGKIKEERIALKRPDKLPVVISLSCHLFYDKLGNPTGIEGIIQDITHTVRVEEALIESEKTHHLLENNIPDVIWTADMEMNLTYISPSVIDQRGFTQEEALAISIQDSLTPDSYATIMKKRQEGMELLQRGMPNPESQIMELEFLHKNGSPVCTKVVITPAFDRNGNVIGVVGVSRSICENRITNEKNRESEQKYRLLVEEANEIVFSVNQESFFTYVSPKWTELLGHEISEVVGKPAHDFLHPEDFPRIRDTFIQSRITGKKISGNEYRIRHKNGTWHWHSHSISPIYNNDGNFEYYIGVAHDITAKKKIEEELQKANRKISFLSGTTHQDMIKPLSGVLEYLESAKKETDPDTQKNLIDKAYLSVMNVRKKAELIRDYQDPDDNKSI